MILWLIVDQSSTLRCTAMICGLKISDMNSKNLFNIDLLRQIVDASEDLIVRAISV